MRYALVAFTLLLSAPAMAADQFDLVCSGELHTGPYGRKSTYQTRYKIDLANKLWCYDTCGQVNTIFLVEPTKLTLEKKDKQFPRDSEISHFINRTTGGAYRSDSDLELWWSLKCDPAEFSGFPTSTIKF